MAQQKNVHKKKGREDDTLFVLAIVGLIINLIFLPGLGTIIGGRINEGLIQIAILLAVWVVGVVLIFTLVGALAGIPLIVIGSLAVWIWGIISGVQMIKESRD